MDDELLIQEMQQIIQAYQNSFSQNDEAFSFITKISNQLTYLPKLIKYLQICPRDNVQLMTVFILIKELLYNRGCLLNISALHELLGLYMNIILEISSDIAKGQTMSACSDVAALLYRFIFELMLESHPTFDHVFALLSSQQEPNIIIALHIMSSIVEVIKKPMKHISVYTTQNNIIRMFQETQISAYFKVAADFILGENINYSLISLQLMSNIFKFLFKSSADQNALYYVYSVPKEMMQFYSDFSIPQKLFQVYKSTKNKIALENLTHYSCAPTNVWCSTGFSLLAFIDFMTANLIELLNDQFTDDNCFVLLSILVCKIGKICPSQYFSKDEQSTLPFLLTVQRVSVMTFQSILKMPVPCSYFLKFWGNIADRISYGQIPTQIAQIAPSIFEEFVNSLLNSVSMDLGYEGFIERYNNFDIFIKDCEPLWLVSSCCMKHATNCVGCLMSQLIQQLLGNLNSPEAQIILCRLAILVLVDTSRFMGGLSAMQRNNPDIITQYSLIIGSVFELINKTKPILNGLVGLHGPTIALLEKAIKYFAYHIKRCIPSSEFASKPIFEALQTDRQSSYDILIDRLVTDLSLFYEFPDLLSEIMLFLNQIVDPQQVAIFSVLSNNSILQSLINHQIFLEFNKITDLSQMYKLVSKLNRFYSRLILSSNQMINFLSYFDVQFQEAASKNFQDSQLILIIYRELNGVFKGVYSIEMFLLVFRWFLNRHVNNTILCIRSQSNSPIVLKSILNSWHVICSDKGRKLVLPKSSAEGIILIRSSLQITDAVMQSVPESDFKMQVLIKILSSSITSKYSNFGIMKMYGDTSFEQIVIMFLECVKIWPFINYSRINDMIMLIAEAISSIVSISPEAIENATYFPSVLNFFFGSIISLQETSSRKFAGTWLDFCGHFKVLTSRFENENATQIWTNFRPHFVALLDAVINCTNAVNDGVALFMFDCLRFDGEYVGQVLQIVCSAFEEGYREEIAQKFHAAFSNENGAFTVKRLKLNLSNLRSEMLRFAIRLATIPDFSPLFSNQSFRF